MRIITDITEKCAYFSHLTTITLTFCCDCPTYKVREDRSTVWTWTNKKYLSKARPWAWLRVYQCQSVFMMVFMKVFMVHLLLVVLMAPGTIVEPHFRVTELHLNRNETHLLFVCTHFPSHFHVNKEITILV